MANIKVKHAISFICAVCVMSCEKPAALNPEQSRVITGPEPESIEWEDAPWLNPIGPEGPEKPVDLPDGNPLVCGTYNILSPTARQLCPDNSWDRAKPAIVGIIREMQPDVMTLNELEQTSIDSFKEELPEYELIVKCNVGGRYNWAPGILYNPSRLDSEEEGIFWLADPEPSVLITEEKEYSYYDPVSDSIYAAGSHRCCVWARFRDRESGKCFYYFATHPNYPVDGSSLINTMIGLNAANCRSFVKQASMVNAEGLPLIAAGDMNTHEGMMGYLQLASSGWEDCFWAAAGGNRIDSFTALNPGTSPGYDPARYQFKVSTRIDLVFVSNFAVGAYRHIYTKYDNPTAGPMFPSDHIPVRVEVVML